MWIQLRLRPIRHIDDPCFTVSRGEINPSLLCIELNLPGVADAVEPNVADRVRFPRIPARAKPMSAIQTFMVVVLLGRLAIGRSEYTVAEFVRVQRSPEFSRIQRRGRGFRHVTE